MRLMAWIMVPAALTLAAGGLHAAPSQTPAPTADVGVLTCTVGKGPSAEDGLTLSLECVFDRTGDAPSETYVGELRKLALDSDLAQVTVLTWQVMAQSADLDVGALAGVYETVAVPGSGEGAGESKGKTYLAGGAGKSITLLPLSVSAESGIAAAPVVAELRLSTVKA